MMQNPFSSKLEKSISDRCLQTSSIPVTNVNLNSRKAHRLHSTQPIQVILTYQLLNLLIYFWNSTSHSKYFHKPSITTTKHHTIAQATTLSVLNGPGLTEKQKMGLIRCIIDLDLLSKSMTKHLKNKNLPDKNYEDIPLKKQSSSPSNNLWKTWQIDIALTEDYAQVIEKNIERSQIANNFCNKKATLHEEKTFIIILGYHSTLYLEENSHFSFDAIVKILWRIEAW